MKAPRSLAELSARASALAGRRFAEVAAQVQLVLPPDTRRAKGIVGQLAELALGATAQSLPIPDFPELGVELKTVPIGTNGKPSESTHVCTAPMRPTPGLRFEQSTVAAKLAHVLWLPVEADAAVPLAERRFGRAVLWRPDAGQLRVLREDWEELMEMLSLGQVHSITARHGTVLQLRPKARNASQRVTAVGPQGDPIQTNPRAFYLRSRFTAGILAGNER